MNFKTPIHCVSKDSETIPFKDNSSTFVFKYLGRHNMTYIGLQKIQRV